MERLALFHVPGHVACGVAHVLGGGAESEEAAEGVGIAGLGGRPEDPGLQLVVQDVGSRLQRADLGCERAVVEQERRVRESDRRLGEVLHLHEDVDGPIELGERWRLLGGGFGERRRAGQLADVVHALLGPADQQDVSDGDHVVGAGIEPPVHAAADRDHPHARLRGQGQVAERPSCSGAVLTDPEPRRHLVGVAEILSEGVRDPEARGHDPRDVGGGIAHALDGMRDPQHRGHALRVFLTAGREHRRDPQSVEVPAHPLLEPLDLLRQLLLVEEDGRVGQVDHELRGVLQFDEEVFDVARLVVHHGSTPDVLMTRRIAATPARSRSDVMKGTPWLSGSMPKREVSTAR